MKSTDVFYFEEILRDHGYRVTGRRVRLLMFLSNSKTPLSAANIQKELDHNMDKVTLYRALEDFVKSKIIGKVNLQGTATYYEFLHKDHHHHHIICEKCGKIEDIENCNQVNMIKETLKHSKLFSTIHSHSLEFFGVCNTCSK